MQNLGYSGFSPIPTAAMKKGDFSSELGGVIVTDPSRALPINKAPFTIPEHRIQLRAALRHFPHTVRRQHLPQSHWDPAFAKILSLYPDTNQPIKPRNLPGQ